MSLEHYAEVWTSQGDGCYRYVDRPNTPGQPMRCPHQAVWIGQHRDGNGRWHAVRSCDGHRGGLTRARRLPQEWMSPRH
jgi:hypothetical protein